MRSNLPRLVSLSAALALVIGTAAHAQPDIVAAPPARALQVSSFDGLWCGTGLIHMYSLQLEQQQADVQGTLARPNMVRTIEGHVQGRVLRTQTTKIGSLMLERAGDELRITGGDGPAAIFTGLRFQRAPSGACAS
ncbi:MAG TPA: hypothetical protein VKD22_02880 [Ramlibacter sp.]|nr:hypothetical protein [Ramlibacter sp.]